MTRLLYPHSLSYQETSLTNLSSRAMPAFASKMDECGSVMKSVETTSSSVYPRMPFKGPSAAALTVAQMSAYEAPVFRVHVRSTTETSHVGTRKAIPVSLPLRSGSTLPTALAAPVPEGIMLKHAPRPPRQSLPDGPSNTFCVAV